MAMMVAGDSRRNSWLASTPSAGIASAGSSGSVNSAGMAAAAGGGAHAPSSSTYGSSGSSAGGTAVIAAGGTPMQSAHAPVSTQRASEASEARGRAQGAAVAAAARSSRLETPCTVRPQRPHRHSICGSSQEAHGALVEGSSSDGGAGGAAGGDGGGAGGPSGAGGAAAASPPSQPSRRSGSGTRRKDACASGDRCSDPGGGRLTAQPAPSAPHVAASLQSTCGMRTAPSGGGGAMRGGPATPPAWPWSSSEYTSIACGAPRRASRGKAASSHDKRPRMPS